MSGGFLICMIGLAIVATIWFVFGSVVTFIGWLQAMNRSTYLPLTEEEMTAAGITTLKEYVAYIYEQLAFQYKMDFGITRYSLYSSPELRKDIESAMIAFAGVEFKDTIRNLLRNMFIYRCDYGTKTMTEEDWKELAYDGADSGATFVKGRTE